MDEKIMQVLPFINEKQMCELIGMNCSLFYQYKNGQKVPSETQIKRIREGIGIICEVLNTVNCKFEKKCTADVE